MKSIFLAFIILLSYQGNAEDLVITGNVVNNQETLVVTTTGYDYYEIAINHLTKLPQIKEGDMIKAVIAAIDGDILVASDVHRVVPFNPPPIFSDIRKGKSITYSTTLKIRTDESEVWVGSKKYNIIEVHRMSDGSSRYFFNKTQFIWVHKDGFGVYKSAEKQVFFQNNYE